MIYEDINSGLFIDFNTVAYARWNSIHSRLTFWSFEDVTQKPTVLQGESHKIVFDQAASCGSMIFLYQHMLVNAHLIRLARELDEDKIEIAIIGNKAPEVINLCNPNFFQELSQVRSGKPLSLDQKWPNIIQTHSKPN